jgi:CRISPR-associated endonuclease/helicase Cas3
LQAVAEAPRYSISQIEHRQEAEAVAADALASNKRVLWVVNKVRVAQQVARVFGTVETAEGLRTADGVLVLCYHSRFTLDDRKQWHDRVVKAFKRSEGEQAQPMLAITTQVCEMSLDLDADVLITEEAPITALIQRMGRCNRKNEVPKSLGEVFIYRPDDVKRPYTDEDRIGVPEFIELLVQKPSVSQAFLEEALRKAPKPPVKGDRLTQFVVSGPYADGDEEEFRDIDDFARQGILNELEYLRTPGVKRAGLIVPVPKKLEDHEGTQQETRYLVIAKRGHYHKALGLCDDPV